MGAGRRSTASCRVMKSFVRCSFGQDGFRHDAVEVRAELPGTQFPRRAAERPVLRAAPNEAGTIEDRAVLRTSPC